VSYQPDDRPDEPAGYAEPVTIPPEVAEATARAITLMCQQFTESVNKLLDFLQPPESHSDEQGEVTGAPD
jgi:hypothetical protein